MASARDIPMSIGPIPTPGRTSKVSTPRSVARLISLVGSTVAHGSVSRPLVSFVHTLRGGAHLPRPPPLVARDARQRLPEDLDGFADLGRGHIERGDPANDLVLAPAREHEQP